MPAHRRHDISDKLWKLLEPHLPGSKGMVGRPASNNRLFINAVFWILRTGAPWRDLPPDLGNWKHVQRRFCRWRDKVALKEMPEQELEELVAIYQERGLSRATAEIVARELTEKDVLGAHIRDELGLSEIHSANPLQAAFASGVTFTVAAAVPVLAAFLAPPSAVIWTVLIVTVLALVALGALGAKAGGAPVLPAVIRVVGWGIFAMLVTSGIGSLFGVAV